MSCSLACERTENYVFLVVGMEKSAAADVSIWCYTGMHERGVWILEHGMNVWRGRTSIHHPT